MCVVHLRRLGSLALAAAAAIHLVAFDAGTASAGEECYSPTEGISLKMEWHTDSNTGCRFLGIYTDIWGENPPTRAEWKGDCKNNLAEGKGSARYYWLGDYMIYFEEVLMNSGIPTLMQSPDVDFRILTPICNDNGYRYVDSIVNDFFPYVDQTSVVTVSAYLEQEARRICGSPTPEYGIFVRLLSSSQSILSCAKNPVHFLESTDPNGAFVRSQVAEQRFFESVNGFKVYKKHRELAAEQQAESAKKEAKKRRLDEFMSEHGVEAIIKSTDLTINPYAYEDITIGVRTQFNRMLSKEAAIFYFDDTLDPRPIFVSGIPTSLFTSKRYVVLAIEIKGVASVNLGSGDLSVPHGEYVGVFLCEDRSCAEIID